MKTKFWGMNLQRCVQFLCLIYVFNKVTHNDTKSIYMSLLHLCYVILKLQFCTHIYNAMKIYVVVDSTHEEVIISVPWMAFTVISSLFSVKSSVSRLQVHH